MVDSISDVGGVGIAESSSVGESVEVRISLSLTLAIDSIVDTRVGGAIDSTIVTNSTIDSIVEIRISLSLRLGLTLAIDYSMTIVGGDIAMVAIHSVMNSEPVGCVPGVSFSLTLAIDNMVSNTSIGVAVDSAIVTNSAVHSTVEVRISLSLSLSLGVAPSKS